MKLPSDEYSIHCLDMPLATGALISRSPDGYMNIYVNARLSYDRQREALRHELRHWVEDDFDNDKPIRLVEQKERPPLEPTGILSTLCKASDLLPKKKPVPPLTPYQKRLIDECLAAFDAKMQYGYIDL